MARVSTALAPLCAHHGSRWQQGEGPRAPGSHQHLRGAEVSPKTHRSHYSQKAHLDLRQHGEMNSDSEHSPPADHKSTYSEDTVHITAKQESYQATLINSPPPKHLRADWKGHTLLQGRNSPAPPSTSSSEPGPQRAPQPHGQTSTTAPQQQGSRCPAALGKASPAGRGRASAGMWLMAGPCGRRVTGHRGTLTPDLSLPWPQGLFQAGGRRKGLSYTPSAGDGSRNVPGQSTWHCRMPAEDQSSLH